MINLTQLYSNDTFGLLALLLATMRVYLELINFNLMSLPISKMLARRVGEAQVQRYHKMGLYCCVGLILLFGPEYLFYS